MAPKSWPPPAIRVIDTVRHVKDIQLADSQLPEEPTGPRDDAQSVTIPSPPCCTSRGGRAGISKQAYPELDPVLSGRRGQGRPWRRGRACTLAGCRYVQMDDTNMATWCDGKMREAARQRGDDPDELPHRYANFINKVVAHCKPAGMTLAVHTMPRQLQEHVGRARQLRAGGRGPAQPR